MAMELRDLAANAPNRSTPYGVGGASGMREAPTLSSFTGARAPVRELDPGAGGILGASAALHATLARARMVAPTESSVLVTGETGTGKELLARALHGWSRRATGPFVSINCGATPHALMASELFGHERGAFTGAVQRRCGRFELAARGTLFLDEVGELPMETQVLLLRVLQEREFERVGGTAPISADVRVVAATNRELQSAVAEGRFRSDLFYRLTVFPIEMPPLRKREGDLRLLVEHFVRRYARKLDKAIRGIDPETLRRLEAYSWPGNVRELQNVVERSMILCQSDTFAVDPRWSESVPAFDASSADSDSTSAEPDPRPFASVWERESAGASTLAEIQREAILRALRSCNWVIGGARGAAARLGLKRTTLQARMKKLDIAPPGAAP